jgi:signal transduction histidine kinase
MKALGLLNTRIGVRFLAMFLAISLLPLAVVDWYATRSSEAAVRQQTLAILRSASDGAEAQLREFLKTLKGQLLDFTEDEQVRDVLESASEPSTAAGLQRLLTGPQHRIPEVEEVFVVNPEGKVVASSDPGNLGKELRTTEYFERGRKSFFTGDLFKDPITGKATWVMTAPIKTRSGRRLLGIAGFRIDLGSLTALTTGRRVLAEGADTQSFRLLETGETYIVNRDRLMITESRYLSNAVLRVKVDTLPVRVAFESGQEMAGTYTNYCGVEVSGASIILRDAGWVVLTEIDFRQAFAPVARLRDHLIGVTMGLGLVVIVLAWYSTGEIIDPIQRLNESDRALAIGDQRGAIASEEGLARDELGSLVRSRNARVRALFDHQRELEERTARLKDTLSELEQMSYSIIHDMRAPLRAIIGFSDIILAKDAAALSPESRDHLTRMEAAARRMDHLICDVLNYSSLVRQDLPLHPVNTSELLRGILETYPAFQSAKATISVISELPTVLGNEAALTQCFSNLLDNAVKFVPPGRVPQIRISAGYINGRARISVEDNGIGIPKVMLQRLFGLFQRGASPEAGTGVGLAIVRKAVERMGGSVGATSEPGIGSKFWIELRTAESPVGQPKGDGPSERESQMHDSNGKLFAPAGKRAAI